MVDNAERSANGVNGDSTVTLPVHQEGLRIGTRTVDTGRGVRVRKSVMERPYKIDEALLHDEVVVKHVPVDQIVSLWRIYYATYNRSGIRQADSGGAGDR